MRAVGAYLDVALGAQVVDLCGLHLVNDLHQARAVSQVPIMQLHVCKTGARAGGWWSVTQWYIPIESRTQRNAAATLYLRIGRRITENPVPTTYQLDP